MDINDSQDFNIDEYSVDDLKQLFDIPNPMDAQMILAKINNLISKFMTQDNPEFVTFLEEARAKLIKSLNPENTTPQAFKEDEDDNTLAKQVLDDEYWDNSKSDDIPNRKTMTRIISKPSHPVMQRERLGINQNKNIEFVQGQLNPDLALSFINLLNIDSHYREIVDVNENLCPTGIPEDPLGVPLTSWKGQVSKNNLELDTPSNFTFDLSQPIKNVEEIQLNDVQIPRAWYVFDVAYGTNSFEYDGNIYTITPANYNGTDLATAVTNAQSSTGTGFTGTATFDPATNKITIKGALDPTKNLVFFNEGSVLACNKNGLGGKRDYNLGWLMGFREKSYTGANEYTSEALVDTFGPKYLYIVLDDFNRNRIGYNLLGMTNNRDNFKLPSYYNPNTMKEECKTENLVEPKTRPCRKGTPADKEFYPVDNLTKAQQYTANSIIQAQNSKSQDRYFSPNNPNILAKIPVSQAINYNSSAPLFGNISLDHSILFNNKRKYFGPVTIKRLNVQLLNDKGYNVNMNNMDWSMSLKIKQLYQY